MIFALGLCFWIHGAQTQDALFHGEKLTGQILTGFYLGLLGSFGCYSAFLFIQNINWNDFGLFHPRGQAQSGTPTSISTIAI